MSSAARYRYILGFILLFLAVPVIAADVVIVVHAQSGYDEGQKTRSGIERVLAKHPHAQSYFLQNDSGDWFINAHPGTVQMKSQFGEHTIDLNNVNEIVLTGAQLGACLQSALRDILLGMKNTRPIRVIIPPDAVISIDDKLLVDKLAEFVNEGQRESELHRIFSRTISSDRRTRRKRVNIEMSSGKKYSLTDKKLGTPYRFPDLILVIAN